jgi:cytochrome P450
MLDGRFSNVPHVPRAEALFDAPGMVENPIAVFERYRASLGPTWSFHFGGARRAIVTTKPALIEALLTARKDRYFKSDIQITYMVEFQGEGLVNLHGDAWHRQRQVVAKGFQPSRLSETLPSQREVLEELLVAFDEDVSHGIVDVHAQMVRLTLGMVGTSIFGRAMTDRELAQIGDAITEIQAFIVRKIVHPYLIPWYRISGQDERYQALRREADAVVLAHLHSRRSEGPGALDLLRLLMETPYRDTGEPMAVDQVKVEALQLLVAGNETSSNALTWLVSLLARHPEHRARVRNEVREVFGAGPIDAEGLQRLEHTTKVLFEALRLYPPFWMIDRIAREDDELDGVHVPRGTLVIPYLYGLHRNADHWASPERFDPARFDVDARAGRHRFAFAPFGGGPRICVGNSMAVNQIVLVLATLIRRYDWHADDDMPAMQPMMLLRPRGRVPLHFTRLKDHGGLRPTG